MVVKTLDGCAINGHYWVYAAGLTDVGLTLTVLDTRTGTTKVYENELGNLFETMNDLEAAACP